MNFKACEGEKSAAYQAYVSIFKPSLTQKFACKKTQKEGLKRMNFKACEGEKSAAYQAYVSIFKPSATQKFAFSGPPTKRFYYL